MPDPKKKITRLTYENDLMSKVLSQRNKDKNWVQRGLDPEAYPTLTDKNGNTVTHQLGYTTDNLGNAYVRPNVVQKTEGSQLDWLNNSEANKYARETNTNMKIPDIELAEYYSQNGLIKHAMGGSLNNNNNNMTELNQFNEGGTHSQNPLGGIPVGGNNTVEQGETKSGDFVYSNRIMLTPEIIRQYNLPKSLGNKSVADATKFIDGKFKDRTDKISESTKQGMLSKIAEAQEAMKPQEPTMNPEQNQMFLGGETLEDDLMPGMGSATKGLTSLMSGDSQGAITGGLSSLGSIGGTAIGGPIGGMIGGAIGEGVGGLINGIGQKRDQMRLENKNHMIASNKFSNDFALGGNLGNPPKKPLNGLDFQKWVNNNNYGSLTEDGIVGKKSLPLYEKYGSTYNNELLNKIQPDAISDLRNADLNRKSSVQFGQYDKLGQDAQNGLNITEGINPQSNNFNQTEADNMYNKNKLPKADLTQLGNTLGQAARYAPIAMNAYQLSQLKKPEYSKLNRLDQRFNPEYVDEQSLQNIANSELNNVNNSLTSATNGSVGALRSNMVATGLNRNKALSEAYMGAEAQNRQTNLQGQQFNAGINQANLGQDNLELDINDKNKAAYDNEKSKYLAEIGNGIGDIGKEETFKRIAKTTTGYNWLGQYQKQNPNATKEETEEAARKAGVLTDSKPNALGGYLFKNKRK